MARVRLPPSARKTSGLSSKEAPGGLSALPAPPVQLRWTDCWEGQTRPLPNPPASSFDWTKATLRRLPLRVRVPPRTLQRYELAAAEAPHKGHPEGATPSVATEAWPSGSRRRVLVPCFRGFESHRLFHHARQAEWFRRRHHTPHLEGSIPSSRTTGNVLASENLRSTSGCCGVRSPDSPPRPSRRSIRAYSSAVRIHL